MDDENYQYCKIFVKTIEHEPVKTLLGDLLGGMFQRRDMTVGDLEVAVLANSYASDPPELGNDFVVWPVMIELTTDAPDIRRRMVETTGRVLVALWDADLPAVAACDYEDELPWSGGIQRIEGTAAGDGRS